MSSKITIWEEARRGTGSNRGVILVRHATLNDNAASRYLKRCLTILKTNSCVKDWGGEGRGGKKGAK